MFQFRPRKTVAPPSKLDQQCQPVTLESRSLVPPVVHNQINLAPAMNWVPELSLV
jgi:hypothetical protein